jgi:DNA-binding NarL/FixJ family response regulator
VKFLALSVSDAAEDVVGTIRAGARGYLTKSVSPDELTAAIHRVADGDAVFSPWLAGFVLDAFGGPDATPAGDPELDQLTPREQDVLLLLARGTSTRRSQRGCTCRSRRSRRTCPTCCASCSSPTATS